MAVTVVVALVVAGCSGGGDASPSTTRATTTSVHRPPSASMPPSKVLAGDLSFRLFSKMVRTSQLGDELDGARHLTVFAPRDAAFTALGRRAVRRLTTDRAAAAAVVRRHAVTQAVSINDLLNRRKPLTDLAGDPVEVSFDPRSTTGPLKVGGAAVTSLEAPTDNGFVVVTSGVVAPAD